MKAIENCNKKSYWNEKPDSNSNQEKCESIKFKPHIHLIPEESTTNFIKEFDVAALTANSLVSLTESQVAYESGTLLSYVICLKEQIKTSLTMHENYYVFYGAKPNEC